ncbi:hypothetical protein [Mucilaginibacter segetis]|uniref:Uncharacterized protein n=1 Tax=Mucilaginibacter segetis TaxID=2793071 RepID=A0A934UPB3_9SPHI|nr:hypothetical protein [Mucilaginibacter segetis]MBK0380736.1 hypothetical protein [Mucilaginibacter segetis]
MHLLTLITYFILQGHPDIGPHTMQPETDTLAIDTSRYAVLTYTKSRDSFLFDSDVKPADLSAAEIAKIEKIIRVMVKEYNKANNKTDKSQPVVLVHDAIKKPGNYYKQLIAVTDKKGEKLVWVNCFCTPHEKKYWKKGVVMVLDGGPCFFNIKINLSTNTVLNFKVNGTS